MSLFLLPVLATIFTGCQTQEKEVDWTSSMDVHYDTSEQWVAEDESFPIRSGMSREEVNRLATPIDLAGRIFYKGHATTPVGYLAGSHEHYDVIFDDRNVVIGVYKSRPATPTSSEGD